MTYQRSASSTVALSALAEQVFELLDNPAVLGAHMEEPSVMRLGTSMTYQVDNAEGRAVGSVFKMTGLILGRALSVEAVVTERHPPLSKTWETRGTVRLPHHRFLPYGIQDKSRQIGMQPERQDRVQPAHTSPQ